MKELKNHDYIFIDRVDEEFIRDFGEVFVDGQVMDPEKINGRLFKVTGNNRLAAVD